LALAPSRKEKKVKESRSRHIRSKYRRGGETLEEDILKEDTITSCRGERGKRQGPKKADRICFPRKKGKMAKIPAAASRLSSEKKLIVLKKKVIVTLKGGERGNAHQWRKKKRVALWPEVATVEEGKGSLPNAEPCRGKERRNKLSWKEGKKKNGQPITTRKPANKEGARDLRVSCAGKKSGLPLVTPDFPKSFLTKGHDCNSSEGEKIDRKREKHPGLEAGRLRFDSGRDRCRFLQEKYPSSRRGGERTRGKEAHSCSKTYGGGEDVRRIKENLIERKKGRKPF